MPIHLEPLTRGLWTARDPAFLPEGALVEAKNLRYEPGDLAVFQAEGRKSAGDAVVTTAYGFVNLIWDPGSYAVKGKTELYQMLYVDSQGGGDMLVTREVRRGKTLGEGRSYKGLTAGFEKFVGKGNWETVAMADRANGDLVNWFVLSPGTARANRNLVVLRGAVDAETTRRQVFGNIGPLDVPAPLIKYQGGVDLLVEYGMDRFMLHSTADHLYFGQQSTYDAIEFPRISPCSPGQTAVWEYWNGTAWVTLSVVDGTNSFMQYQGFVRFTPPSSWFPATYTAATGRTLPVYFNIFWREYEFFWTRVRLSVGGKAFALAEKPVGYETVTVINRADQRFLAHGLPQSSGSTVGVVASAGAGLTVGTRYEYWWNWADEYNNHESDAGGTEKANVAITAAANAQATLSINFGELAVPASATHVHIYRGQGTDGATPGLSYPTGKRIYSIPVTALRASTTYTFVDTGTQVTPGTWTPTGASPGVQTLTTLGQAFPLAVLADPVTGTQITTPRCGAPPSASTGDVYQESLVLNDLADPRKIRFSYPGQPHNFPSLFYVNLETKDSDRVIAIRSLGTVLGIVATGSVWRLNWLPRESDVDFSRGEMLTQVMGYGAEHNTACTTFSPPGGQKMLAIAGPTGLYMTDLYQWKEMVPQFKWSSLGLEQKILVNNPYMYRLEIYVPAKKAVWYVHYHETLVQEGVFPITGPMERPGDVKDAVWMQSGPNTGAVCSTAQYGAWFEGDGNTDAANGQRLAAALSTREIWLAGMGREFKLNRMLLHTQDSWITNPLVLFAFSGDSKPQPIEIVRTGPRRLEMPWMLGKAEFVQMKLAGKVDEDFGLSVTTLGLDADSLGERQVP